MTERSRASALADDARPSAAFGAKKLPRSTAEWIRSEHPGDLDDPGRRPQFEDDDSETTR